MIDLRASSVNYTQYDVSFLTRFLGRINFANKKKNGKNRLQTFLKCNILSSEKRLGPQFFVQCTASIWTVFSHCTQYCPLPNYKKLFWKGKLKGPTAGFETNFLYLSYYKELRFASNGFYWESNHVHPKINGLEILYPRKLVLTQAHKRVLPYFTSATMNLIH